MPKVTIYVLAYYPVNYSAIEKGVGFNAFKHRTNERVLKANKAVEQMAISSGCTYLNLNSEISDSRGNLKQQYTVDGVHMYANGYEKIFKQLLPLLKVISF